jgi:hypothetical protein
MSAPDDARRRIGDALLILAEPKSLEPHQARRTWALVVDTLRAAERAFATQERELENLTTPDLELAHELERLRAASEAARDRIAALERQLVRARGDLLAAQAVATEDSRRRTELEQRSAQMNELLLTDEGAFDRFMDQALARDEARDRRRRKA